MESINPRICIIDYGAGNVRSVFNIFKSITASVKISNRHEEIDEATHLVLPGVGAFGAAMDKILSMPSFEAVQDAVIKRGKPFLGICVGLQVLASLGYENGCFKGLGWVAGEVNKLDVGSLPLPHVGWNNLNIIKGDAFLSGIDNEVDFYFVHSYFLAPDCKDDIIATSTYGMEFPAIIKKGNVCGVQFHPEKSQRAGMKLLKNFLELR